MVSVVGFRPFPLTAAGCHKYLAVCVHQFFNDFDIFVNASRCRLYDIRALDVQLFAIRKECIGVILCDFHDCFVLALCTFDHLVLAGVRIGA